MQRLQRVSALFDEHRWSKPVRIKIRLNRFLTRDEISARNSQILRRINEACGRQKHHPLQALVSILDDAHQTWTIGICIECPRTLTMKTFVAAVHLSLKPYRWWVPHKSTATHFNIEVLSRQDLRQHLADAGALDSVNCTMTSRRATQRRKPRRAGYEIKLRGEQLNRRCLFNEGHHD